MNKINQAFDAHLEQVAGQKNAGLAVAELLDDVNPIAANLIREDIAKAKP